MRESVRKQYLDAMGVQVYRLRDKPEDNPLSVSPLTGGDEKDSAIQASPPVKGETERGYQNADDDLHSYMQMDESLSDDSGFDADDLIELPDLQPLTVPAVSTLNWQELQDRIVACKLCELCNSRKNTVFGVGNPNADVMLIGEAPGADEDAKGEPFVGVAGKLLDNMLKAIGLDRKKVFIANILKCRPPSNRNPSSEEAASCEPYLMRQIELIQPKLILSVGGVSAKNLLKTDEAVGRLRLQKHQLVGKNIPVLVTYHPAYLLRKPSEKAKAWEDLKKLRLAMAELEI